MNQIITPTVYFFPYALQANLLGNNTFNLPSGVFLIIISVTISPQNIFNNPMHIRLESKTNTGKYLFNWTTQVNFEQSGNTLLPSTVSTSTIISLDTLYDISTNVIFLDSNSTSPISVNYKISVMS
jgi:hypothetical protein